MAEQWEYVVVGLGALGSATAYHLARRGHRVLGLERFGLGHSRGASHDTSRILRHSYHTPGYVGLTFAAYDDWAELEAHSGEQLVTVTGGLDLYPPGAAIDRCDYTASMAACGVPFEELERAGLHARWPQLRLPAGTVGIHQARSAIVPAARGVRVLQREARRHGAVLRDESPVTALRAVRAGVEVDVQGRMYRCRRLVVCADAWTNEVLAGVGHRLPLTTTLEQVTYFAPPDRAPYRVGRLPLWIWMDNPSYYGFPCYGEATVKAAQDCGGPPVDPDDRPALDGADETDRSMRDRLSAFVQAVLPGAGVPVRSVRCMYTLTPDRDFVLGPLPGHESVLVGLGAAHGFKFAPTLGRLLAELAVRGEVDTDLAPFRLDRPALTDASYDTHWLV